jgi:hypothetical protein
MFAPWKWISPKLDDKPVISERAILFNSESDAGLGQSVKEIKFVYAMLGYIDSKASALMRFDGVVLAVLALVSQHQSSLVVGVVLALVALLVFLSIVCCVLVIDISWPFLGLAVPSAGQQKTADELKELRKVLYFRECAYRWAWIFAAWAMIFMFIDAVLWALSRFGLL